MNGLSERKGKQNDCLGFKFGLASTSHVWCVREKQTKID